MMLHRPRYSTVRLRMAVTLLAAGLGACSGESAPLASTEIDAAAAATPKAVCGAGSLPETGLQGRVSRADVDSGRAAPGFTCNAERVGSYLHTSAVGTVSGFTVERYVDRAGHECAYHDSTLLYPTNAADGQRGVNSGGQQLCDIEPRPRARRSGIRTAIAASLSCASPTASGDAIFQPPRAARRYRPTASEIS
jgi:hypothetical protein